MKSPPISEWELWACANEMIGQHGEEAGVFAAMRADEMADLGDEPGARTWRMIVERINRLQAAPGETIQ